MMVVLAMLPAVVMRVAMMTMLPGGPLELPSMQVPFVVPWTMHVVVHLVVALVAALAPPLVVVPLLVVQGLLVVVHLGQVLVVPLVAMEIVSDHSTLASIYDCSTSCSTAPLQGSGGGSTP